jgi:DNA repair exonuclease SbcCD ATPase subunit
MIVTRLKLANLRGVTSAPFRFQPGFNLVVGINGVGKTTMLDALSVCLSNIVASANRLRTPLKSFTDEDIRIGADVLDVECGVSLNGQEHRVRWRSVARTGRVGQGCRSSENVGAVRPAVLARSWERVLQRSGRRATTTLARARRPRGFRDPRATRCQPPPRLRG